MSLRVVLERLGFGRRPPTGPLTTAEQATADEVHAKAETEQAAREHADEAD